MLENTNKSITVKDFLNKLNTNLEDSDTKEMLDFSYYENENKHYELIYDKDYEVITEDSVIERVEESNVSRG